MTVSGEILGSDLNFNLSTSSATTVTWFPIAAYGPGAPGQAENGAVAVSMNVGRGIAFSVAARSGEAVIVHGVRWCRLCTLNFFKRWSTSVALVSTGRDQNDQQGDWGKSF